MSSFLELKTPSNVCNLQIRQTYAPTNHPIDINSELDELDREEFYRLKKVSGKKQRDVAAADAEMLAARQKAAEEQAANPKTTAAIATPAKEEEPTDVLGEDEDNDVIF